MRELAQITSVIGRRETLRCAGIGVLAATGSALLTACGGGSDNDGPGHSVKAQTLAAFAVGTWHVTFPLDDERDAFTIVVTKGKWHATIGMGAPDESNTGTWKVVDGTVKITGWLWGDSVGTATGVPNEIDGTVTEGTVPWIYKPGADSVADDPMPIRFEWKPSAKTLTIHGTDADENPLLIKARRS